jgi:hypothetical protein
MWSVRYGWWTRVWLIRLAGAAPSLGYLPAVLCSGGRFLYGAPHYEVWRHDARGTTQLDAGGDIDPTSLRLRGHRIEWARAGQVATSDLT